MDSINNIISTTGLKNFTDPILLPFDLPTKIYSCMISIWLLRPQLQRKFPLHKLQPVDFLRFLAWCVVHGRKEYPILRELAEWNKELSCVIQLPQLKKGLKNKSCTVAWYLEEISKQKFSIASIAASLSLTPRIKKLTRLTDKIPNNRYPLLFQTPHLPFGVNLFGYACGELGIGEDVRMLAQACNNVKIPFCVVNVQPGKDVSQGDTSINRWITDQPKYFFNVFCMTGIEFTRVLCEKGLAIVSHNYNIGLWPWELPNWPNVWHHAWNGIHEIWGISSYTVKAYERAPMPKIKMPLPVMLGEVSDLRREDFNLPLQDYLFIFSFDFNSKISRKNPEAVISAFQRAFLKESQSSVGLIIKVNHPRSSDPKWMKIKKRIGKDKRIHLVEGTLRKKDLMALYKCCDCMISLHRAEGFGRILAEAQLLGLEIIATGFSGNMDFCDENNISLVNYNQCTLSKGEYFFAEKQVWADPDINHAAELMYGAYNRERREKINYNTHPFDISYCGEIYKKRLTEIYEIFNCMGNNQPERYSQPALPII